MLKALGAVLISLCCCLPCRADKSTVSVDREAIREQVQKAVRDLQAQLPELLNAVRVSVQVPEIRLQSPEITIQVPQIVIPAIQLQGPVRVQIPEIHLPDIRIEIPKIDIQAGP